MKWIFPPSFAPSSSLITLSFVSLKNEKNDRTTIWSESADLCEVGMRTSRSSHAP